MTFFSPKHLRDLKKGSTRAFGACRPGKPHASLREERGGRCEGVGMDTMRGPVHDCLQISIRRRHGLVVRA